MESNKSEGKNDGKLNHVMPAYFFVNPFAFILFIYFILF